MESVVSTCVLLTAVLALAPGCVSNGCEEALEQTKALTQEVCSEEGAFSSTPFCTTCVDEGYLSTTGPPDCRCRLLAYDQGVCAIPSDDEAKSSIREAIKWANESCGEFTIGLAGDGGGS